MGIEEKDFKETLPDEPSYQESVAAKRKKREDEYDKLPKALREIADLADNITEYWDSERYYGK